MQALWWGIRDLPWSWIIWQLVNIATYLILWQAIKHYYARAWMKAAPEKAKDMVRDLQRALAESELERQQLTTELAEARGRIAGAKARLRKSEQLSLVERG
jgi:hypothetical protein